MEKGLLSGQTLASLAEVNQYREYLRHPSGGWFRDPRRVTGVLHRDPGGVEVEIPRGLAIRFTLLAPPNPSAPGTFRELKNARYTCNLDSFTVDGPMAVKVDPSLYVREPSAYRQAVYADSGARIPEWIENNIGNWPRIEFQEKSSLGK